MTFKCAFTFYGGKSKIAHLYPAPTERTVIEPFCGGASYSLRYADRDVWINDLDDRTVAIWRFMVEHQRDVAAIHTADMLSPRRKEPLPAI